MNNQSNDQQSLNLLLAFLQIGQCSDVAQLEAPSVESFMGLLELAGKHAVAAKLADEFSKNVDREQSWETLSPFFGVIQQQNQNHNLQLQSSAQVVSNILKEKNIATVLLKGGAFLFDDDQSISWRATGDLDILVATQNIDDAAELLLAENFQMELSSTGYESMLHHHYAPLYDESNKVYVELHRRLMQNPKEDLVPASDIFDEAVSINIKGQEFLIPCPTHRMIHLIAHAQISNWGYTLAAITLKDIVDVMALTAKHDIDWKRVQSTFVSIDAITEFEGFLLATHDLSDMSISMDWQNFTAAQKWANLAIKQLHTPKKGWRKTVRILTRYMHEFRQNPARRRILWHTLKDPERMKTLLRTIRS